MSIFSERIKPLFDNSGMTDRALEEEIGLPRGIVYKWKAGKNKNYKFYIVEIAAYFHVSADYLLGNTDDPRPVAEIADAQKNSPPPEERGELFSDDVLDRMTPEQLIEVINKASQKLRELNIK